MSCPPRWAVGTPLECRQTLKGRSASFKVAGILARLVLEMSRLLFWSGLPRGNGEPVWTQDIDTTGCEERHLGESRNYGYKSSRSQTSARPIIPARTLAISEKNSGVLDPISLNNTKNAFLLARERRNLATTKIDYERTLSSPRGKKSVWICDGYRSLTTKVKMIKLREWWYVSLSCDTQPGYDTNAWLRRVQSLFGRNGRSGDLSAVKWFDP